MATSKTTAPKTTTAAERDKLIKDLNALMADAKALTSSAADDSQEFLSEKAEELKAQLSETLEKLKAKGVDMKESASEKADEVEELIRKNPWKTVGIALLAGVIIDRFSQR